MVTHWTSWLEPCRNDRVASPWLEAVQSKGGGGAGQWHESISRNLGTMEPNTGTQPWGRWIWCSVLMMAPPHPTPVLWGQECRIRKQTSALPENTPSSHTPRAPLALA